MIKFKLSSLCVLACTALALPVYADIVVGQSVPLTGGNAELGIDIRSGALAYFKKINDAGGIQGQRIKLVSLDDKNDAKLSAENTKNLLANENPVALFGYASSTLSLPAMPLVVEKGIPFFAPFTGADAIRQQNEFVYTVRATYAEEIKKIIDFWAGIGAANISVLHYDDTIGKENFQTVAQALKAYNKQPVSVAIKRNTDITPANVDAVIAAAPSVLLITTLSKPAAQMVKSLKTLNKKYMYSSLSFAGANQLAKSLGEDARGISAAITVPNPKSISIPVVKECVDAWVAAGEKSAMSVTALESCMAAKVLIEGIKRAGKDITPATLHRSLGALGSFDTGGYVVNFKPNSHHGSTYVSIVLLKPDGQVQ